jgi:cytochrome o ubiquinol oxidase operon protein cyoD
MNKVVVSNHDSSHGSVKSYTIGFILSVLLTLVAYIIAAKQAVSGWSLIYVLLALAIVQLFVQLVFFLHLNGQSKSRWNLVVLTFAAMVVLIVVGGSLWIMKNLNYSHDALSPQQLNQSIVKDEGYQPSSN